jgi:hypothetical protein
LRITILCLIAAAAVASRLFSVIRALSSSLSAILYTQFLSTRIRNFVEAQRLTTTYYLLLTC